jgi:hypothetical protein
MLICFLFGPWGLFGFFLQCVILQLWRKIMVAWRLLLCFSLVAIDFVSVVRQWGFSQTLGSGLISGRTEEMMMERTVLRRRGLMTPHLMRRWSLLIWMLMDIFRHILLVPRRRQLRRWR